MHQFFPETNPSAPRNTPSLALGMSPLNTNMLADHERSKVKAAGHAAVMVNCAAAHSQSLEAPLKNYAH